MPMAELHPHVHRELYIATLSPLGESGNFFIGMQLFFSPRATGGSQLQQASFVLPPMRQEGDGIYVQY